MFASTIAGSLPTPAWLAETGKLWPRWLPEGADLAQAAEVMGGHDAAERWMAAPAVGLDGARPIELMRTLQGAELVSDFLGRLEHGVYS